MWLVGMPRGTATLGDSVTLCKKVKHIHLTNGTAVTLLSIYVRELVYVHMETCSQMFATLLFILAKN